MLDQQLSQSLATRGIGLADVLIRQLSPAGTAGAAASPGKDGLHRAMERMLEQVPRMPATPLDPDAAPISAARLSAAQPPHVQAFHSRMATHAQEASRITGIPAKFILAQAALESGWGRREITGADGTPSHNV